MGLTLLRILLRHAVRNVRHGGLPFFFATLMTGLGLFALGVFATVVLNFQRLTEGLGHEVGAVAFLTAEDAGRAEETRARIALLHGVGSARLVTPEEAMDRVKRSLGETGALLEGSAGVGLPWIVEVAADVSAGVDLAVMLESVRKVEGVDEVMHPSGDVERIEAILRLMEGAGLFLAVLIALVVVVVVSNTVKLTLFARREEIAIMKLVGATDGFVKVPFLFEGLVQGLGGALLSLLGLLLVHATVAGLIEVAVGNALGTFTLEPLPLGAAVWIVLAGAVLGVFGAAVSIGRFLRV